MSKKTGGGRVLLIFAILLLSGSIFYIVYTSMKASALMEAEERFNLDWNNSQNKQVFRPPIYLAFTRPLLKGAYLEIALGFYKVETRERWKKKIISAGLFKYIQPEQFLASQFWFTLIVALGTLLFVVLASDPPPLWLSLGIVAFAYFMPVLDISSRTTQRQNEIRLAMPYVVDLLTLSTEAGLDFIGSIGKVVEKAPTSALLEELSTALKDIQLGLTRAESLRAMAERVNLPEMRSFVATLVSAEAMGTSIGTVLRAQSDTMRNERLIKAEKLGAAASQKIIVPIVMIILPAVMLMIFGPMILGFIGAK